MRKADLFCCLHLPTDVRFHCPLCLYEQGSTAEQPSLTGPTHWCCPWVTWCFRGQGLQCWKGVWEKDCFWGFSFPQFQSFCSIVECQEFRFVVGAQTSTWFWQWNRRQSWSLDENATSSISYGIFCWSISVDVGLGFVCVFPSCFAFPRVFYTLLYWYIDILVCLFSLFRYYYYYYYYYYYLDLLPVGLASFAYFLFPSGYRCIVGYVNRYYQLMSVTLYQQDHSSAVKRIHVNVNLYIWHFCLISWDRIAIKAYI